MADPELPPRRLLILGGTAEAAALARAASARFAESLDITTSLAGRLPTRPDLPGRLRVGPFGGTDGLARWLRAHGTELLIDATHPFAAQMSRHAAEAATVVGLPRLRLERPAWEAVAGDRWIEVADSAAAAAALPALGRRVFLATGAGGLGAFAALADHWFLIRTFASPAEPPPLPNYRLHVARPPFDVAGEQALLRAHAIEVLVSKNSGGPTDAKLAAARTLGLPVVMLRRPEPPPGAHAATTAAALDWITRALTARPAGPAPSIGRAEDAGAGAAPIL